MNDIWYVYLILLFMLLLIYLPKKRRRRYIANRLKVRNKFMGEERKEKEVMKELAERFIGKDVYIKLLEGTADGFVKEVTDSGIVMEYQGKTQIVNLDFVIKIKEYPYKNGKRGVLWGE